MTSIAIGVVSYSGTRFSVSQGEEGLAALLARKFQDLRVEASVRINSANAGEELGVQVSEKTVQESLTAQVHLDQTWARYLGRSMGARWWIGHALRWGRRLEQRISRPSPTMITRLLNIEASHLELLRWGIDSEFDWILILEDDAMSGDYEDCAHGLLGLMTAAAARPAFVNISESFSTHELGIDHLLSTVAYVEWAGPQQRTILGAAKPVTNTVCAILYSRSTAITLLDTLESLPMEPVVPIDWKLNLALMQMFEDGTLAAGDCWLVEPAPITQMSMR